MRCARVHVAPGAADSSAHRAVSTSRHVWVVPNASLLNATGKHAAYCAPAQRSRRSRAGTAARGRRSAARLLAAPSSVSGGIVCARFAAVDPPAASLSARAPGRRRRERGRACRRDRGVTRGSRGTSAPSPISGRPRRAARRKAVRQRLLLGEPAASPPSPCQINGVAFTNRRRHGAGELSRRWASLPLGHRPRTGRPSLREAGFTTSGIDLRIRRHPGPIRFLIG